MRIKYLPLQPHCFAYGGFDIQMVSTSNATSKCNVDISKMDIWDRNMDFDILHCWGLGFSHYENFFWAKKSGKKLIATILVHDNESIYAKFRFKISSLLYKQKMMTELLRYPDKIVVVNENQANFCNVNYKVPSQKIHIIPNVVDDAFFAASENNNASQSHKYALTVGNICARKNQLLLAEACIKENIPLVLVGKILDGEQPYGDKLKRLVNSNSNFLTWIPELKENSVQLIDYYKNCTLFALPSYIEQQPISMLEAATMQKPILTSNRLFAKQKYYQNAEKVDPFSVLSIQKGLNNILKSPTNYIADGSILSECRSKNIGQSYKNIYSAL